MRFGVLRVAALAILMLGLSSCSMSKWLFENASGQAISLEPARPTWLVKAKVIKAGAVISELPETKDDGILRVEAGGCRYTYGAPWPGYPHAGRPAITYEDAWLEQSKQNPSKASLKVRLDPDFTLRLFHLNLDETIDREITDGGFPRTPEKTCGTPA